MNRTRTLLTTCVALVAVAAAAPIASAVPTPSALTRGAGYLALGDSVTFGYQEPQVVPAPNYKDAVSFLGYPEQVGAELHVNIANAACPGETSSSLINSSAPSNGCENSPKTPTIGYRTLYPLHVHYSGSQLTYAVAYLRSHRRTALVSLMIGANDIFRCQSTTPDMCLSKPEQQAVFATIARNVRTILSAIRTNAGYRGQIAIVNYYSLDYNSAFINGIVSTLNSTQDTAAKPFGVVIASGFDQFKAASLHSGSNPCTAGLLTQLGSLGKCGVHPSYAGQALLAQALLTAIRL